MENSTLIDQLMKLLPLLIPLFVIQLGLMGPLRGGGAHRARRAARRVT